MTTRKLTTLTLTATGIVAGGVFTAAPASAGGIGDFLSPAFGTSCASHNIGSNTVGNTTVGTGALNGNLAGRPAYRQSLEPVRWS
ncbi:hypothetical protein [Streptomyces sp. NPDC056670]|uniref:hypothetical protein n=1 Tax=Streptomyces sp. NPDC056670 TaxID=3345904 RepID=UPI003679B175